MKIKLPKDKVAVNVPKQFMKELNLFCDENAYNKSQFLVKSAFIEIIFRETDIPKAVLNEWSISQLREIVKQINDNQSTH